MSADGYQEIAAGLQNWEHWHNYLIGKNIFIIELSISVWGSGYMYMFCGLDILHIFERDVESIFCIHQIYYCPEVDIYGLETGASVSYFYLETLSFNIEL